MKRKPENRYNKPTIYYLAIKAKTGLQAARIRSRSFSGAKGLLAEKLGPVEFFQVNATWKDANLPGSGYALSII